MAVTKIHPIKTTLNKAIDYICNPNKTDDKILISSYGCSYETADIEFGFTLSKARDKGDNLGHHLIQSFAPREVSYEEAHRKYVSNKKSYYQIRNESDRLCKEHGLSVVTPGQERFTRSKTLGEAYTVEAITERIAGTYRAKPKALRQEKAGISMLIDIQNSIKAAESKGYEQWAKIHNLKQAAKTLNFLTEHNISEYEQLQAVLDEVHTECENTAATLKDLEKRLSDISLLMKNISAYQQTKAVYAEYKKAKDKEKFLRGNESSIKSTGS